MINCYFCPLQAKRLWIKLFLYMVLCRTFESGGRKIDLINEEK